MKYRLMLAQWMVLATAVAAAPQSSKPPKPEGNRFLFILETSSGMTSLEHGGRQAIFDLIYSGVDGRMRSGDTYGIWPFNEQVYSGLVPMQTWEPQKRLDHASAIGRYLRTAKYEKDGNFEVLVKEIQAVVRGAKDVNIFVVTDGNTRFAGTPFDRVINAGFEANRALVHVTKKPLVVTFVAREGALTAACVTPAGQKIELAELVRVTNAVPETAEAPTAEEPAAKPVARATNAPIDMSRALIMRGPKSTNVGAAITMTPPAVTNEVVAATTNEGPEVVTTESAESVTTNEVVEAVASPAPAATSEVHVAEAPEPLPSFVPAQVKASARTIEAPISVIAAPTAHRSALPNVLLMLGGAFVGASAVGALLFMRKVRSAKQPSIISESFGRR